MRTTGRRVLLTRTGGGRLGSSGSLATATIGDGRRWPVLAAMLAVLLVPAIGIPLLIGAATAPAALAEYRLAGDRAPGCIRLVVVRDQSGSMADYAAAREQVAAQLLAWVARPDVLRADDEIAVIDFAGSAAVALPVTPVADLTGAAPGTATVVADGTDVNPVAEAIDGLPDSSCAAALVMLTDGYSERLTAASSGALTAAGVATAMTIAPAGVPVAPEWIADFPYGEIRTATADDVDANARAIGEAVALATGQRLEKK